MLSLLDRHHLAISHCGVPLTAELLRVCLSNPETPRLEQALIWLALLHGLDKLGQVLSTAERPLQLNEDQRLGLFAALNVAGNAAQAREPLQCLLGMVDGAQDGSSTPWQVMNRLQELAKDSPYADLICEAGLLHLSNPSELFEDWLGQFQQFINERMPLSALLRISIFCLNADKLPRDWQTRLANTIDAIGELADATPIYRLWMVACQVVPDWDYACIRAADLALRFEDYSIAKELLDGLEPVNIENPWFYDVRARCCYANGDLISAARMWSIAITKMPRFAPENQVMQDRLRSSLRGKLGIGEVSRLTRCRQTEKALDLLRIITLYDPCYAIHYQMFFSLHNLHKMGESGQEYFTSDLHRMEYIFDRFRYLWQHGEELPENCVHFPEFIKRAEHFLDRCEEMLKRTSINIRP